jgi:hypothetical protein
MDQYARETVLCVAFLKEVIKDLCHYLGPSIFCALHTKNTEPPHLTLLDCATSGCQGNDLVTVNDLPQLIQHIGAINA